MKKSLFKLIRGDYAVFYKNDKGIYHKLPFKALFCCIIKKKKAILNMIGAFL